MAEPLYALLKLFVTIDGEAREVGGAELDVPPDRALSRVFLHHETRDEGGTIYIDYLGEIDLRSPGIV